MLLRKSLIKTRIPGYRYSSFARAILQSIDTSAIVFVEWA